MTYSDKLKDPRWQKKRLEVLERDSWLCQLCGDNKTTLHVHHKKYNNDPWDAEIDDLKTYCEDCHAVIEYNKKDTFIVIATYKIVFENKSNRVIVRYLDENNEVYVDFYKINQGKAILELIVTDDLFADIFKSFYPEYQIEQNG